MELNVQGMETINQLSLFDFFQCVRNTIKRVVYICLNNIKRVMRYMFSEVKDPCGSRRKTSQQKTSLVLCLCCIFSLSFQLSQRTTEHIPSRFWRKKEDGGSLQSRGEISNLKYNKQATPVLRWEVYYLQEKGIQI